MKYALVYDKLSGLSLLELCFKKSQVLKRSADAFKALNVRLKVQTRFKFQNGIQTIFFFRCNLCHKFFPSRRFNATTPEYKII